MPFCIRPSDNQRDPFSFLEEPHCGKKQLVFYLALWERAKDHLSLVQLWRHGRQQRAKLDDAAHVGSDTLASLGGPILNHAFALPAEIADIAAQNKAAVYDLLFRAASQTMLTIAADPRHLGARIGITAVLHNWGSALTHHPHIHMIVPDGGISLDGQRWVSSRPAFLLPVRVLGSLFRRLFLTRLLEVTPPGGCGSSASRPSSPRRPRSGAVSRSCAR